MKIKCHCCRCYHNVHSSIKEPIAYLHVFHPSIDAIHWHLDMHQYFIFSKICRTKRILPKNSCNVLQIIGFYITLEHIFHFGTLYVLYLDIILERKKMAWCCWWLDCELWHGRFYDILNIFCRGTICIVMLMNLHQNGRGKKIFIFFINFIMNHLYIVLLHILQWIVQLIFLKEWQNSLSPFHESFASNNHIFDVIQTMSNPKIKN